MVSQAFLQSNSGVAVIISREMGSYCISEFGTSTVQHVREAFHLRSMYATGIKTGLLQRWRLALSWRGFWRQSRCMGFFIATQFVGDGDSSVYSTVLPGWGHAIKKLECANHACKCYRDSFFTFSREECSVTVSMIQSSLYPFVYLSWCPLLTHLICSYVIVSGWPHCYKGAADAAPPLQLAVTLSVDLSSVSSSVGVFVFETFNKKVLNQTVIAKAQLSQMGGSVGT